MAEKQKEQYDDEWYKQRFNTPLDPVEVLEYIQWAKEMGKDTEAEEYDYDLRGAYKEGKGKDMRASNGHMTDKWKKPNHPTFSTGSVYNGIEDQYGGRYEAGEWGKDEQNKDVYKPTQRMLDTTHPVEWLKKYMRDREPEAVLELPKIEVDMQRLKQLLYSH